MRLLRKDQEARAVAATRVSRMREHFDRALTPRTYEEDRRANFDRHSSNLSLHIGHIPVKHESTLRW